MTVTSSAITDGMLSRAHGKFSDDISQGMPLRSFPFEIKDAPEETISFAFLFDDPDSTPLCGFPWVHWMGANLHTHSLEEDASRNDTSFVQGVNSWFSPRTHKHQETQFACYGGPAPPDRPHTYVLTVWALDTDLNLTRGFTKHALLDAIATHILAQATLQASYPS